MLNLKRSAVNKFRSSTKFHKHHSLTKSVNVKRPVYRGGIRF